MCHRNEWIKTRQKTVKQEKQKEEGTKERRNRNTSSSSRTWTTGRISIETREGGRPYD